MGPQRIGQSALPLAAVGPLPRGPLGRCALLAPRPHGPVAYSRYLERQNRRDPDPRLSDVFERSNLAAPPGPPGAGPHTPPTAASPDATRAADPGAAPQRAARPDAPARLYAAPRIGDVTPIAGAHCIAPATRTLVRTLTARDGGFDTII